MDRSEVVAVVVAVVVVVGVNVAIHILRTLNLHLEDPGRRLSVKMTAAC